MSKNINTVTLSLIIPVFNEENYLKDCLDSIARQTVVPDEVIVVDNNSTDNTAAVAKSYPFVRVIFERKKGIAHARDAGFNAAHGDIIGRIDADTRLLPGWVEHVKRYYHNEKHRENALSGFGHYYNMRWPKAVGLAQHWIAFIGNRAIMGHYILWGSNMALPRTLWLHVKSYACHRKNIHEDIDLAIHLNRKGYKIDYRKSMLVRVEMRRVHTNRNQLWANLLWWPRTLRTHHYKTWPLALLGAMILYALSPLAVVVDRICSAFGKPAKRHPRKHLSAHPEKTP